MSSGCLLSSSTFFIPAQSSTSTLLEYGQFTNTVMATFFGLFVCVCVCVCVSVCVCVCVCVCFFSTRSIECFFPFWDWNGVTVYLVATCLFYQISAHLHCISFWNWPSTFNLAGKRPKMPATALAASVAATTTKQSDVNMRNVWVKNLSPLYRRPCYRRCVLHDSPAYHRSNFSNVVFVFSYRRSVFRLKQPLPMSQAI